MSNARRRSANRAQMRFYYGNKYPLKEEFLKHFEEIGVVRYAARKAGVSTSTVYRWLQDGDFFTRACGAFEKAYENKKELLNSLPEHKKSIFFSF